MNLRPQKSRMSPTIRSGAPTTSTPATPPATASATTAAYATATSPPSPLHRHCLDHRRVQRRHGTPLRGGVHAQPGRRDDARRQRGLRSTREGGRLALRRPHQAHRRRGPHPFEEVRQEVQDTLRTAQDISPEWRVRMQGAFQDRVDSAISKTTKGGYPWIPASPLGLEMILVTGETFEQLKWPHDNR